MRDIHSNITLVSALGAAVLAADALSAAIDLRGYDAAEVILSIGAGGIVFDGVNKIEFKLTHSEDNVTYDAVTVEDVIGISSVGAGGIIKALTAAHAAASVYRYGYKGRRRYVKLQADFSGAHATGTPVAGLVLKGNGSNQPETDQA